MVLHNSSKYDYHFIMKELAKESEEQFKCLGKHRKRKKKRKSLKMIKEMT